MPDKNDPLPKADVVVVTWTVDELAGLAKVITPKVGGERWHPYARNYDDFKPKIRPGAPAANSKRLASSRPTPAGSTTVLCIKSELHLNQDGIRTGDGTATLPVKDLFLQIIAETEAEVILTIGTAGVVYDSSGSATSW